MEKDDDLSLENQLWPIKLKLKGIAFLIQDRNSDAPIPLDIEDCYYGIGEILNELAEQLGNICRHVAEREFSKRKKAKKKMRGNKVAVKK